MKLFQRTLPNGATSDTLATLVDVSQFPASWAGEEIGTDVFVHLAHAIENVLVRMGAKAQTYCVRSAYTELTVPRASVAKVKRLVARHESFIADRPPFLMKLDPAWRTIAEQGLRDFDAAPERAELPITAKPPPSPEKPSDPVRHIRSGIYVDGMQATVVQIATALEAFLSPFGKRVERQAKVLDGGAFKNDGLLGIAIHEPVSVASGTWIGVIDSVPRSSAWMARFAAFLHARTGADMFWYWTGTPKQNVAESKWLRKDGSTEKSGSWKRVVAAVEAFPHPWVRFADLGPDASATVLVFAMDQTRFGHAVEFGSPHWSS